jgi:hypothetical protein
MPKGSYTRTAKAKNAGRKTDPNKMVSKSQRLPQEIWDNTTSEFRRNAILTAFRAKIK